MARIGISITKSCAFRDSVQEFSNTYYYEAADVQPNNTEALAFIDEVANAEKTFHSTAVTFVRGACWSAGGTAAANQMIAEKNLTGAGSSATALHYDRERAFLVQWPAGVDSRGHGVSLKKWYHSCGGFGSVIPADAVWGNTTGFTSAQRTTIANLADALTRIGSLEAWGLVSKVGRTRDGGAPISHRFLEHHQLGDMWR
jgi:hypothetical protein